MKKSALIGLFVAAIAIVWIIVFLIVRSHETSSDNYPKTSTWDFNTYDPEAERKAEALSDSGFVSAEVLVTTGATQIMNTSKATIPDVTSEKTAPVGKLIEE